MRLFRLSENEIGTWVLGELEDLEIRLLRQCFVRKLLPAHVRHDYVGEQQPDVWTPVEDGEGCRCTFGMERDVSGSRTACRSGTMSCYNSVMSDATSFQCPHCDEDYKVVRIEASCIWQRIGLSQLRRPAPQS